MSRIYNRVGAAAGAFFVVGAFVGSLMRMSGMTDATDGAGILANIQRDPTVVNQVGLAWLMLGFAAFLVFASYLNGVLRRAEGPDGWLATVSLGAGLLYLALQLAEAVGIMAASYRRDELSADLARTLVDLTEAAFVVSGLTFGLFVASSAAVCLAHRVLTRWLGWVGLVAGVLAAVAGTAGILDMAAYNPLPFVAGLLWVLLASIVLAGRREPAVSARAAAGHAVPAGAAS